MCVCVISAGFHVFPVMRHEAPCVIQMELSICSLQRTWTIINTNIGLSVVYFSLLVR